MTGLPTDIDVSPSPRGEALFANPTEISRLASALESAGLLHVTVEPPSPSTRGRLRELIEGAVESALQSLGAAPPGLVAATDLDASLSDQLFRARHMGMRGLVVHLPPLFDISNLASALDAEDSAVLRWWIAATKERPVVLLVDEANRHLGAYGPPTALENLLSPQPAPKPALAPARSSTPTPASSPEPALTLSPTPDPSPPAPAPSPEPASDLAPTPEPTPSTAPAPSPPSEPAPEPEPAAALSSPPEPAPALAPPPPDLPPSPEPPPTRSRSAPPPSLPPPAEWRSWAVELDAAKGPKPLGAIERLFTSRYVPLRDLFARGGGDDEARASVENWATSFSRSYSEAFNALRVTGKRPTMVLDVPEFANRLARLHGARSTQLVLVDSMRFDLGQRVHERMRRALGADAACAERLLLWSALPTNTASQLELLARGPEGLALHEPAEREEQFARGRGLTTLRRVKVGPRDLLKLDVIEAKLRESGPPIPERFDALADEAAEALVGHARLLQPRTLMFVFGDHGFQIEGDENGSGPSTQGGASPEEVLVPGFAWIIGGVH